VNVLLSDCVVACAVLVSTCATDGHFQ